jgi:CheY-like chemotaxis protein
MRVLIVEDEPYMAEAIRDGLRLSAIAADVAGDGDTALELLGVNAYDIAVLDRDIPGPSGDEIAKRIVASGSGTVWVATSAHPKTVVLTVENTGAELSPQLVSTIVEPFQRGTGRIRDGHVGVGLGLAIVKSITLAHDGTLTLTPRPGGGLRVTVQLPAAPPAD